MAVIFSNDEELRRLIYEHASVIVKYHKEDCPICEKLAPVFTALSDTEEFKEFLFVRIESKEHPIAKLLVKSLEMPFAIIYKNGKIIDSLSLKTELDLNTILNKLRAAA